MNGDRFDRVYSGLEGLPGTRMTRPSTQIDSLPLVGNVVTYVVQSVRHEDGVVTFLQIVDDEGRARIILPEKISKAIADQRERLFDRSTTESRKAAAAKRERDKRMTLAHVNRKHDPVVRMAKGLPAAVRGCRLCAVEHGKTAPRKLRAAQ